MDNQKKYAPAMNPNDLPKFFIERANAGDVDGLEALYAPEAVLISPEGQVLKGAGAIREFYAMLLTFQQVFQPGDQRPAIRNGTIALTSSRLTSGQVTAEIAQQQPDGSWLWVIDQPAIARE